VMWWMSGVLNNPVEVKRTAGVANGTPLKL
jgi:hypothetical protein